MNRNYENFQSDKVFGCVTEHDKSGKRTAEAFTIDEKEIESERVQKFVSRTKPKIGEVHDPISDTLAVPKDHTFGHIELPDAFDVNFLIHKRPGQVQTELKSEITAVARRVRLKLSQLNWAARFSLLEESVSHFDPDGSKKVPADALLIILNRIGFPVDDDQTILLFGACLEDGKVNFDHFLKIIDYRSGKLDKLESTLTDDCLLKLSKESAFTTKYDVHDGTFNSVSVKNLERRGVPSIRSDLAAPILRRISDDINYGDEGDTGSLVSPSISAHYGITEADYYQKRTKHEIHGILRVAKVAISDEAFDRAWESVQDENCEASLVSINTELSK